MPAKPRTPPPADVVADVMYAANRTCCVCQTPGKRLQVHHLDNDPTHHDFDNLAVLCFDCHDETEISGGFGRKLDTAQVKKFRTEWYAAMVRRRAEADRIAVAALAGPTSPAESAASRKPKGDLLGWISKPQSELDRYVDSLPEAKRLAYEAAKPMLEGSTVDMVDGGKQVIDVFQNMMERLAKHYPAGHFAPEEPRDFIGRNIESRFAWHGHRHSTAGHGRSGTIVGPLTVHSVMDDADAMVVELVSSLTTSLGDPPHVPKFAAWLKCWRDADPS